MLDDAGMDGILRSHAIDPAGLRSNSFEAFYKARRAALLALIERAMGKTTTESAALASDDDDEDDLEGEVEA